MRNAVTLLGVLSLVALLTTVGGAQGAAPRDARAIMELAHRRDTGEKLRSRLRMTITADNGRERVRGLELRQVRVPEGRRTLMIFESPADVRGTGLLTFDYDDGSRTDDQWLYLPSLRRTTRIAGQGRSGSFAGSDFSFADFTVADPSLYEVRLLESSEVVEGEPVWHVEATPRTARTREETGYERMQMWIGKRSHISLRLKAWMPRGRVKYIAMSDVRAVNGIPTAHRIVARTVLSGRVESQTVLERLTVSYADDSVQADDFTQQRLQRGL